LPTIEYSFWPTYGIPIYFADKIALQSANHSAKHGSVNSTVG